MNLCACVDTCVHLSVRLCAKTVNKCVQERVCVCESIRQLFGAFSQAPLSLHKCVCLSRSQPVRVCVCVYDCKCLSETE